MAHPQEPAGPHAQPHTPLPHSHFIVELGQGPMADGYVLRDHLSGRGIRPMSDRGLQARLQEDLGLRYEGCSGQGGVEIDRVRNQQEQWEANYSQSRALRNEGIKKYTLIFSPKELRNRPSTF